MELPSLAKLRTDTTLPLAAVSSRESELPSRSTPYSDMAEPKRDMDLSEKMLPTDTKSSTDSELPNLE